MNQSLLDKLRSRYASLFGEEPSDPQDLKSAEESLGIVLPSDFKEIARFYRGGMLGGISHNAIAAGGRASNILDETFRLRESVGLPKKLIVLAEPPASLVVLNTETGEVTWLDATDVENLARSLPLRNPQIWPSYAAFFEVMLEQEDDERAEA